MKFYASLIQYIIQLRKMCLTAKPWIAIIIIIVCALSVDVARFVQICVCVRRLFLMIQTKRLPTYWILEMICIGKIDHLRNQGHTYRQKNKADLHTYFVFLPEQNSTFPTKIRLYFIKVMQFWYLNFSI